MRATLIVLLVSVLAPSAAFAQASAQASIAGVVRDASGAVLPGVTVEASQSRADRESPQRHDRWRRSVPHRRPADRRLRGHVHAARLFDRPARRTSSWPGAFTATVSVELRVGALEETITVTGETPIVDVQSARRQQVLDDSVVSAIPTGPHLPQPADRRARRRLDVDGRRRHLDDVGGDVHHPRRAAERRAAAARRHGHRRDAERRRHVDVQRRRRQRRRDRVHHLRRSGRSGDRRAGDEHRAADRRQHPARLVLRQRVEQRAAGRQPHARSCATRA